MAADTEAPVGERQAPAPAPLERPRVRELIAVAIVFLGALGAALLTMKIWTVPDMRIPFSIVGDNASLLSSFKTIDQTGWYQHNPALGWPHGQDFYDFSANGADNLHYAWVFVASRFTDQIAFVENVFILLSYPATGLSAYGAMRWLGVSRAAAVVPAILFAILPYHFLRAPYGHGLIAEYSAVPAGAFLAMAVLLDKRLFARREGGRKWLRWASWRTLGTLALCVLVASGGIYYCVFGLFLIGFATVVRLLAGPDRRPAVLKGGVVLAAVLGTLMFHQAPTLIYKQVNGPNLIGGVRQPVEAELYAFKLARFVFPSPVHRVEVYGRLGRTYEAQTPVKSEGSSWPGTIPLLGLAFVLAGLLARAVAVRAGPILGDRRLAAAGVLAVAIFVMGTLGGGNSIIAWALSPSMRAWDRMSVVLAFFGVLGVALALDRLRGRVRGPLLAGGLAVLLAIGVFDQTSPAFVPNYQQSYDEWVNDERFVNAIEEKLGGEGEIFQLPYMAFPENGGIYNALDYSHYKGFLHAGPNLRWSYGAMRGRPADWQYWLVQQPYEVQVRGAAGAGFDGIWVDTAAYPDPQVILAPMRALTGVAPLVSTNGRLQFFDLRPYAARLTGDRDAIRRAVVDPVQVTYGAGFYPPEAALRWALGQATLAVTVPEGAPQAVRVRTDLTTAGRATVTLAADGREVSRVRTGRDGTGKLDAVVELAPGAHTLTLATDAQPSPPQAAGDARDLRLKLTETAIGADALLGG